jgi:hypothetical protein
MNALSVGFPGRENSMTTLVGVGPEMFGGNPTQDVDDIGTARLLTRLDRQAFSRKHIDHGQGTKALTGDRLVADKIHAPGDVGRLWLRTRRLPGGRSHVTPWPLRPQLQTILAIQPVHALLVDVDTFALQQNMNTAIALSHAAARQLPNPSSQRILRWPDRGITMGTAVAAGDITAPPFADRIALLQIAHRRSTVRCAYH